MNKPTNKELRIRNPYTGHEPLDPAAKRAWHEGERAWEEGNRAGIAHGWREAIEALRNVRPSADYWADYLTRIAKERGYLTDAESLSPRAGK